MNPFEIPLLTWASDIEVKVLPGHLGVSGTVPFLEEQVQPGRDLFRSYRDWAADWTTKRAGLNAPHILFANASTDQQLITFVKRFGPVSAESVEEVDTGVSLTCAANQSLETLRRERETYVAALVLLAELDRGKKANQQSIQVCLSKITDGCKHWTSEWRQERAWRSSHGHLPPSWHFDKTELDNLVRLNVNAQPLPGLDALSQLIAGPSPFLCGHSVICALVNTFRVEVTHFGNTRCEVPSPGSLLFGVRPVLYYLLRLEYLRRGRVRMCANVLCNKFFLVERGGQQFCSGECSQKQRQRDYWRAKGSSLRRKRCGGNSTGRKR